MPNFSPLFSWRRLWAMIGKEFIQMKRDKGTLSMIIGLPLVQLILFGFAINTNPKFLPTGLILREHTPFTRAFIRGLENTGYFKIEQVANSETQAGEWLKTGRTQFILNIPNRFTAELIRGNKPALLIQADATDPVATANAVSALTGLSQTVFDDLLKGDLAYLKPNTLPFELRTHLNYNPESITQYNVVPGLIGVIVTMTMTIVAAVGLTRERERGTLEQLLATPVQPIEVMIGKIAPYIIVGYVQIFLVLIAAAWIFSIPIHGTTWILLLVSLPFIAANLSIGLALSSIATNQLQSTQMATFFFLPSILLSGFLFPFYGMPQWAQWVGSILPLTHYLRITRGILLKGSTFADVLPDVWPILLFLVAVVGIGVKTYRRTLD